MKWFVPLWVLNLLWHIQVIHGWLSTDDFGLINVDVLVFTSEKFPYLGSIHEKKK